MTANATKKRAAALRIMLVEHLQYLIPKTIVAAKLQAVEDTKIATMDIERLMTASQSDLDDLRSEVENQLQTALI